MKIISAVPELYSAILQLNEMALPHVNSITMDKLSELAANSFYFKVAFHESSVVGFLLALPARVDYNSLNYIWFSERYEDFIYIDRVVVSSDYAGLGFGKMLYQDLEESMRGVSPVLACEVNVKPVNTVSLGFHKKFGFREVGQQETEGGQKRVCLLSKYISDK